MNSNQNLCKRYSNCNNNACNNKIVTYDCNSANTKYWNKPALKKDEDPVYYNVMNGCWLCNYSKIEQENEFICNRQFFSGNILPPCNSYLPINGKLNVKRKII